MSDRCLLLFTKPAHPGRVKTRLIGDLTPAQTAELHAALLADTLATIEGGRFDLRVMWGIEPEETLPVWPPGGQRQAGADLGARLFRALTDAARDYPRVAAIGSDCPEIDRARIEDALSRLGSGIEVVLGPSRDGGYYLIALAAHAVRPEIFRGVAWGTGQVCEQTLERCHTLGLAVDLLPAADDIDRPADLDRLVGRLAEGTAELPATRALLTRWGRLREVTAT